MFIHNNILLNGTKDSGLYHSFTQLTALLANAGCEWPIFVLNLRWQITSSQHNDHGALSLHLTLKDSFVMNLLIDSFALQIVATHTSHFPLTITLQLSDYH